MESNPIALQINCESRNEILRHYLDVLVHFNKIPQLQAHNLANSLSLGPGSADTRILRLGGKEGQYINPIRDWSYIQLTSFSCESFQILCEGASDLMQQLERLEIRGHGRIFYNMVNMKTLRNTFYLQGQLNGLIPRFPALKELRLVVVCKHPWFTEVGDKMLALFEDAWKEANKYDPDFKAQLISITFIDGLEEVLP